MEIQCYSVSPTRHRVVVIDEATTIIFKAFLEAATLPEAVALAMEDLALVRAQPETEPAHE